MKVTRLLDYLILLIINTRVIEINMIRVIPFESLGHQNHGWLDARHHFSFAGYFDPRRMGQPPLRVWNDDTIKAGTGFPMHPHRDMEIITYIRKGAISHEDDLGNKGRTVEGNVQVMSAGSGIMHSEYNLEEVDTTLFQIWIETAEPGIKPCWETKPFPQQPVTELQLLVSGRDEHRTRNVLRIYQDAALWVAKSVSGTTLKHEFGHDRHAYLVVSAGAVIINGIKAGLRDGVSITNEQSLEIVLQTDGEVVLVDLPQM